MSTQTQRSKKKKTEQVLLFELPRSQVSPNNAVGFSKETVLAKGSIGLYAHRILRICASQIRDDDPDDKTYRFSIGDFAELYGLSTEKIHSKIKKALLELAGTTIILPIERGRVTSYISWGQIYDAEVEISFDPILKPLYQKNLAGKYPLQYVRGFAYSYTYRFYELFLYKLKQSGQEKINFYMRIDDLRQWLNIQDSYKNFADIRKRIIIPVISDINGKRFSETSRIIENDYCNLSVTYEEVKESRKVIGLNFDVVKKDDKDIIEIHNVGPDEMPVFEALSKESQIAYEAFKKWKVPQIVVSEAYQKYGADAFYKIYLNVENAIKNGKIKNKGGYAATCLRGGYTFDGETQKTEMEIKQITPEEILETKRLEEKIENLSEEEKEKVLNEIIKKYDNGTVTSSIIKNKTFDELKQDMFGKKIIIDVLKNQK